MFARRSKDDDSEVDDNTMVELFGALSRIKNIPNAPAPALGASLALPHAIH